MRQDYAQANIDSELCVAAGAGYFKSAIWFLRGGKRWGVVGRGCWLGLVRIRGQFCAARMINGEVGIVHWQECPCYLGGPASMADVGACPSDSSGTAAWASLSSSALRLSQYSDPIACTKRS